MFHLLHRNPESAKKKTVTDRHLLVFVLFMVALMVVILLLYLVVEVGLPGYELSKIPSKDHPSEYVGVCGLHDYSLRNM